MYMQNGHQAVSTLPTLYEDEGAEYANGFSESNGQYQGSGNGTYVDDPQYSVAEKRIRHDAGTIDFA